MTSRTRVIVMAVLLAALLLLATGISLAQSADTPMSYTGYQATCSMAYGENWVTGQMLHMRGMVTRGRIIGHPYFEGDFTNYTDVDLNLNTFAGNSQGSSVIEPDAYEGSWQGHFSGPILQGMYSGQAVSTGTKDLARLLDVAHIQEISPAELPYDPCEGGALSAFVVEGIVVQR